MNLTNNPPENKLTTKRKIWLPITLVLIAIVAIVLFFIWKKNTEESKPVYSEEQLPAIKVVVTNGCGYERLAADLLPLLRIKI